MAGLNSYLVDYFFLAFVLLNLISVFGNIFIRENIISKKYSNYILLAEVLILILSTIYIYFFGLSLFGNKLI